MSKLEPFRNVELERQVLGQMLRYPPVFDAYTSHGLQRADFYRHVHQQIFDAIAAVAGKGHTPDLLTVGLELKHAGQLEDVNVAYLSALVDDVFRPLDSGVLLATAELTSLAGKRDVEAAMGMGLEDIATVAERAVSRSSDERRVYDVHGQLEAIAADQTRDAGGRVFLGFPTLDGILEGLRAGEVFGLMARPGIGKTLVVCHITRVVAESSLGHVMFSLEMPAAQIVDRLAGSHYGLSRAWFREQLKNGVIDPESYATAFKRFVLVDAPGLSIAQMGTKLRQIQNGPLAGVPIRLVTIDHLGLVGGDRKMTTYDRVSTQAREIKEMAKRFNCTVLLAVQVNREQGGDGSKELGLGAARDSGVVEEAMDYLVAMRRLDRSQTLSAYERERYRDVLFAKVVKNRHGAPDTELAIRIDGRTLELTEDPGLKIEDNDLSKIASMAGRRGR